MLIVENIPITCHEDARPHDLRRSIVAELCIGSNRHTLQPHLPGQSSPLGTLATTNGASSLTLIYKLQNDRKPLKCCIYYVGASECWITNLITHEGEHDAVKAIKTPLENNRKAS